LEQRNAVRSSYGYKNAAPPHGTIFGDDGLSMLQAERLEALTVETVHAIVQSAWARRAPLGRLPAVGVRPDRLRKPAMGDAVVAPRIFAWRPVTMAQRLCKHS
jgi:hypothetical protein